MGRLYIVATPIGNLEDISLRGLRVLQEVDLILSEDTRTARKLLNHYQISNEIISYHQHTPDRKISRLINLLKQGKNIALVSNAGTPCISDPGSRLISLIVENLPGLKIIPVPGPTALIAAASIAGLTIDRFLFLGFPPAKKKRDKFFDQLIEHLEKSRYPVIFYESPYLIIKTLTEISQKAGQRAPAIYASVGRELTKQFEAVYRGWLPEVITDIKKGPVKGEFVVVLGKKS